MARRNIAGRGDIEPDALRQRRDMYVLAIGLLVFNLAGGTVGTETSFSGMLPVKLRHPWVLIAAAWVGFYYFWFRFWLVSQVRPLGAFIEDILWQVGDRRDVRRLAGRFAWETVGHTAEERRARIERPRGPIPRIKFAGMVPRLSLFSMTNGGGAGTSAHYGPDDIEISGRDRWVLWKALASGPWRAAAYERTFTDYTLPHIFAIATVLVGLVRIALNALG
ncbi:hypothetical protein ABE488_15575 [Luteimonas sp. TWI662]|uniref:hypothetical protein n=1 Tax=Luteimonas sp. TWI662 TaxID=3136789 RepID=UPI00320A25CC